MRRCAAAVFSSGATTYRGLYWAARRAFPRVPSSVRQAIAVTAELFAPIVQDAMTVEEKRDDSATVAVPPPQHVSVQVTSDVQDERGHSCPPSFRPASCLTVAVERSSPPDQIVSQTDANSLPVITSKDRLQLFIHDVETPPRASPVNFDSAIRDVLPFDTSFDLDDLNGSKIKTPRVDISFLTDIRPMLRKDESSSVVAPEFSTPL